MQVPTPNVDPLRFYTRKDVSERAQRSVATVNLDTKESDCPLRFVRPKGGRAHVVTADNLRAYLEWVLRRSGALAA